MRNRVNVLEFHGPGSRYSLNSAMSQQLPASFRSAYRILLRGLSASIRHHPTSTYLLRKLYRPFVEDAAQKIVRQSNAEKYLASWNPRCMLSRCFLILSSFDTFPTVDNTLSFLHSAATVTGVPKRVMKNLAALTDIYESRRRLDKIARMAQVGTWSPKTGTPFRHSAPSKTARDKRVQHINGNACSVLGEAILQAEAKSNLSLGRQDPENPSGLRKSRRFRGPEKTWLVRLGG